MKPKGLFLFDYEVVKNGVVLPGSVTFNSSDRIRARTFLKALAVLQQLRCCYRHRLRSFLLGVVAKEPHEDTSAVQDLACNKRGSDSGRLVAVIGHPVLLPPQEYVA